MMVDRCVVSLWDSRSGVRAGNRADPKEVPARQRTLSHVNAYSPAVWRSPRPNEFGMWPFGRGAGSPGAHAAQLRPLLLPEMRWGASGREGRKKCICRCHVGNGSSNPANQPDGEDNLKRQKCSQLLALDAGRAVPQARYHLEMMHPLPATRSAVSLCQINSMASQLGNPKLEEEKHTGYMHDAVLGGRGLREPSPIAFPAPRSLAALPAPRTPAVPGGAAFSSPRASCGFLPLAAFPAVLAVTCGNQKAPVCAGGCLHSPCVDKRSQRADPRAPAHSLPFSTFPLHKD